MEHLTKRQELKIQLDKESAKLGMKDRPAEHYTSLDILKNHALTQIDALGSTWANHVNAFIPVQAVSKILHINELYQKILDVPGVICEFGVQYGATLVQLLNCRNFYEPHNIGRIIYGFDTFQGLSGTEVSDGSIPLDGDFAVGTEYLETLTEILHVHESFQPRPYMTKSFLIEGDASETIDKWLTDNPHAIISMALFDMDIYKPTKDVLERILPRLTRGSLLLFDELNHPAYPGETLAVEEILQLNKIALRKTVWQPFSAYAIW